MVVRRTFLVTLLGPLAGAALKSETLQALAQAARTAGAAPAAAAIKIPPVSYTCPMHAEVVDDKPGKCPICSMTLQPIRLALVWSCTVHTEITKPAAGQCPKCGRDLIRVTKGVSFTCRVHPKVDQLDPGQCPICKRTLVVRYSIRPHGDHNPKHGGSFLMASNNWHLEVTHPAAGIFRLYVYDAYSKPFSPPGLTARIVETTDKTDHRVPIDVPFKAVPRAKYWEANMPGAALPANIAVKVRFEAGDDEYPCDFLFYDYSVEPSARPRK
jgi:hypothetical protein